MSAWSRGPCWPRSATTCSASTSTPARSTRLNAGQIPIYEPGLEELVRKNHAEGRLRFTTDAAEGVAHARIQIIAVGTPPDEDGSADMSYVMEVAASVAQAMTEPKVVVTKSTVPVGTADRVRATIAEVLAARGSALGFDVVSNPEFLKEGAAVADCMRPERIIVGTSDPASEELLREVYEPFSRNHDKIIVMDVRSAELTKYAANAMLATKISFMNEMAGLAERLGADIEAVRQGIGSDFAHRLPLHLSRRRLRRLLLPQGREGADRHRPRGRLRAPGAAGGRGAQRGAEDGDLREESAATTRAGSRAAPSRSGASPSSRRPTTCARRRAGC